MTTWKQIKDNPLQMERFKKRCDIIKYVRHFFWEQEFLESETPLAIEFPGQEPYLNPVAIDIHDPSGKREKMYLQTSPEFAMKKLIAAGFDKIYQICKCFRDHENFGGLHNPEFTMIEWYRSEAELEQIMVDCKKLFRYVAKNIGLTKLQYKNYSIAINEEWDRMSMREMWQKYLSVDLNELLELEAMKKFVLSLDFKVNDSDSYEDLFFQIFLNKIEPQLGIEKPIFVYDYPAQMCSLSKLSENDQRYAKRFELYIAGMEIANAFGELTDSRQQFFNLETDRSKRRDLKKEIYDVDPEFIKAVGMMPRNVSGIALGVDRMVMLLTNSHNIEDVIFQSMADLLNK